MDELRVLLIGGPPGAGKTTLARAIASRLGFSSTTGDDLVVASRVFTTEASHPELHRIRSVGHTRYFTEGPPERLVSDAIALGDTTWPVFEQVIHGHATSKAPVVIDWWLLSPERVAGLGERNVAAVWIHIDPGALEERERRMTEFRAGSADPERMHENFMHRSLWRNDLVASQAKALGMPLIHQPGHRNVDDLVDEVIAVVGESHALA